MDPTESTLLFNETEPRTLMKRQVAVTGNTFQTVSFVESGIFVLCIFECPEWTVWVFYITKALWLQLHGAHFMWYVNKQFTVFHGVWHSSPSNKLGLFLCPGLSWFKWDSLVCVMWQEGCAETCFVCVCVCVCVSPQLSWIMIAELNF